MEKKEYSRQVAKRFIKAMKQSIADGLAGINNRSDFAARVGEYKQNISKMEAGVRCPTIDVLCRMCMEFGVSAEWLMLGNGQMFTHSRGNSNDIIERLDKLEKIVSGTEKKTVRKAS